MIRPEAPYGQAKFAGEGYLGLWNRMHDLSTVGLRFGNVYGPRQDPLGEAGVIAIFCGKLETGGQPTVFGDGLQTRDYVFVQDVVRAAMLAGDGDVAARRAGIRDRHGADECRRVGVARARVERGGRRLLHQLAHVHHRDPVADVLDHREVVGDE